jgi:uroporphyrinogen decarboxylase
MTAIATGQFQPAARALTHRRRFLNACACQPVDRPPVWLMRQAGRALPEYRRLREKYTFLQLVQTPELAAQVTLQPVRRFDFDAAILFSDILVVPEGMGQPYQAQETGGVRMKFPVRSAADIARLSGERLVERLSYIPRTLRLVKSELKNRTALLGFAGSPWTLAAFMMEGGSAERYLRARALFRKDRKTYFALAEKLTAAVIACLQMQIEAGADAVQIFDSLGGLLSPADFNAASGRWMKKIVAALNGRVPVIIFTKSASPNWNSLIGTGAQVLSLDSSVSLRDARRALPSDIGIQGNLNPALLARADPDVVAAETNRLLLEMRGRNGYIFNLGHGVPPNAKLENIAALVETVRGFK